MSDWWWELRTSLRSLRQNPGFTLLILLSLAVGVGATTTVFSLVNALVLSPLAYDDPERLVMVWEQKHGQDDDLDEVSVLTLRDWRERSRSFEGLAGYASARLILTGGDRPERVRGVRASGNFFELLGEKAALGRALTSEDERPGAEAVAVLGHGMWTRRFASDPEIVGRRLMLDGVSHTVVGVMPAGFESLTRGAELWAPLVADPSHPMHGERDERYLMVFGRLRQGVSLEQARREMETVGAQLERERPEMQSGFGVQLIPMDEQFPGPNDRRLTLILLGIVGAVLLIACGNITNLLLTRATARAREIAVRTALGAGRGRLFRQLLTESLTLGVLGGALGLLLASWGIRTLVASLPADVPRLARAGMDLRVLGFAVAVSLATGLLFGLAPALQASRPDLNAAFKEGGRSASLRGRRQRSVLVVAEIAMALLLFVCTGLLVKSFVRLQTVDPGFRQDNLLTMRLSLPESKYSDPQRIAGFYATLLDRLRDTAGVEGVAAASLLPRSRSGASVPFTIDGKPPASPRDTPTTGVVTVSSSYFETLGVAVVRGRSFSPVDREGSPGVVVVSESFARRFWPQGEPVGGRILIDGERREIVGVAGDVLQSRLGRAENAPLVYVPAEQSPRSDMNLVVRASGNPEALTSAVESAVWSLDRDQPVFDVMTMDEYVEKQFEGARSVSLLLGLFATVALLLAALGVFGLMSYYVTERTHDIGVRMALGARRREVLRLVASRSLRLSFWGVACGLAGAALFSRGMSRMLFDVSPFDPAVFATGAATLVLVALAASLMPARRAMKVEPIQALRYE